MKKYTIIGGLNGAGKSSLSGVLSTEKKDLGVIINVDATAKENNVSILEAGKIALSKIRKCLDMGINFTQETTLSGRRTLRTVKEAKGRGYYIRLYYVGITEYRELLNRIANRVLKGGHNISQENLARRYKNYVSDLCAVLPYCDEAYLYDNENGFVQAAYLKNGELYRTADILPGWAQKIKEEFDRF